MFKYISKFVLLPICMMALLAAFILVGPAFADDGQPLDPPPATEVTIPPQDGDVPVETVVPVETTETIIETPVVTEALPGNLPTEETIVETPVVTEALPENLPTEETIVETPAATEPPVDPPTETEIPLDTSTALGVVEEPVLLDAVAALAENNIALVDASGEPVTMAANASSDLVVTGDPYFTVGSVTYRFMKPGGCGILTNCYESTTPIQDALDFMSANSLTPTDRKLYIEADTYNEDVWVDGTLNGVKGLLGLIGKGTTPEDVQINGSLYINDMLTGFSVCNLSVTNSSYDDDAAITARFNKGLLQLIDVNATATGEDSAGIVIYHSGTVELNRVNASGNGYMGARIINNGSVKITNSSFDNNLNDVNDGTSYDEQYDDDGNYIGNLPSYTGLEIQSNGPVTLNGVSAQGNIGDGADISAWNTTISIKNSVFDNNDESGMVDGWGDGLWIAGNIVTLENIQASNNDVNGIFSYANTSFTALHLHTENNGEDGVAIDTCQDWDSDPFCDVTGIGTVTIKNSSSIGNGGDGFDVYAKGLITLNDIYSADNGGAGYYLNNSDAQTPAAMNLSLVSAYRNFYGFDLYSRGAITITNIIASDNTVDGIYVENSGTGAININNTLKPTVFNEIARNGNDGYYILSNGAITITNLDTYENGNMGGYIDNSTAATAAPVTINILGPINYYAGYRNNGAGGLFIISRGAVTLSHIGVDSNGGVGAEIHNIPPGILAGLPVTVSDSWFNNNMVIDGNSDEHGLVVYSKGLITLLNIESMYNDGDGVYLNNQTPGATAGITINAGANKGNTFLGYGDSLTFGNGLEILTNGAVTLTNVYANDFGYGYGVSIDNSTGIAGVTIKQVGTWCGNNYCTEGNSFSNNSQGGLYITTNGPVTIALFQANNNQGTGIEVDADGGIGAVAINGTSNYWGNLTDNWGDGITITAKGNITLTKVDASRNWNYGASLVNDSGTGLISLTDAYFDNNTSGLEVTTTGTMTWKNGSASGNLFSGADIDNEVIALAGKPVTITNVYTSNNGFTGLSILSKGIVTLTDVESNYNSINGMTINDGQQWVDNLSYDQYWYFDGTTGESVTIQVNSDNFNPWITVSDPDGNIVDWVDGTDGSLSLTFTPGMTGSYDIYVGTDSDFVGWEYDISLFKGLSQPPTWDVWDIEANGIYVDNRNGVNAGVTLINGNNRWNSNNSGTDVVILSSGVVALTNMELSHSGESGLLVNNTTSSTAPGVTLTNVNFYDNDQTAAEIYTKGAVIVKTADLGGNGGYGYYIENNSGTVLSPITFTSVSIHDNSDTGIFLRSKGAVTFNKVWSGFNGGSGFEILTLGAVIFNDASATNNQANGAYVVTPGIFTVTQPNAGYNTFNDNGLTGLYVEAGGKVTLTKVNASWNGWRDEITGEPITDANGIYIFSTNSMGTAPFVITDVSTDGNTLDGTRIITASAVTVTTLQANNNTYNGLFIDQSLAPNSLGAILLNKIIACNNGSRDEFGDVINYGDGIYVNAKGAITINKFDVNSNSGTGANLINNLAGSSAGVTVLNSLGGNLAISNGGSGVNIHSNGAVNVTGLETLYNNLDGLDIRNGDLGTSPLVTLNSIISRNNSQRGIYVESNGVVTINNSWSVGNGWDGIHVETDNNIFVNNTTAIKNNWAGFYIVLSQPANTLKLTNSTWFGNLRNPNPGDRNLMLTGGNLVIL